jgi:hypothetical protein
MPTMKNATTYTIRNNYETRYMTADQFVEVLRDMLHITAEVAKMTMHHMKEGKTYTIGAQWKVTKDATK